MNLSLNSLTSGSLLVLLLPWILPLGAWAQSPEPAAGPPPEAEADPVAQQELAELLAVLEAALEAEAEADRVLEVARIELAGLEDDAARVVAVAAAEQTLEQARADVASTQRLYDAAAERYRIERESEALERQRADAGDNGGAEPQTAGEALGRQWSQLDLAKQEAELARLRTAGLQEELDALEERRERNREAVAEIDERLRGRLARERRSELAGRRRDLLEEERELAKRTGRLSRELLEARVAQRLQEDEVARLAASYSRLQRDLVAFAALFAGALLLLWALRRLVAARVKEPHRRYQLGKLLAFGASAVVVVGFVVIFAQDWKQFVTGLGIAVAGFAIAVQEMVSSYAAWFLIRGVNGYRIGDWIRIGGQEGEVIDVGWLVTVLEQTDPLDTKGETGGARTGGVAFVANAEVFKGSVIHYTRQMPFVWCALRFTVTYDSDWHLVERIAREALDEDEEIVAAGREARRALDAVATDFALRLGSTEPRIRVRPVEKGVEVKVRFLARPRRRQDLLAKLNRQVLEAAAATGGEVEFAGTTRSIPSSFAPRP